ncbi:MAG TPA: short-chain dehydrogenase, partial [Cytophagales bacterium]|nr:short-chain dehydrogenase [Cytophagales bacterium]
MKNRWTTQDIADQSGKFIIITGANSGLGYASAKALAAKGAHVILAVRNLKKGQEAVDKILTSVPKAQLALMQCDVSDLDSVTQFVEAYTSQYDWVDVLMNNAGIMATPPRKTNQGFEAQFATNHLGHFALTGRLMEALKLAPNGSRVINVSSLAARTGKMQFDDIHWNKNYRAMAVYSQSKLANQLFTYGLQRRLDQAKVHNVTSVAAHPGG